MCPSDPACSWKRRRDPCTQGTPVGASSPGSPIHISHCRTFAPISQLSRLRPGKSRTGVGSQGQEVNPAGDKAHPACSWRMPAFLDLGKH